MANIKANIKSIRKSAKRNNRNKIVKTTYKNKLKDVRQNPEAKKLSSLYKEIDKALAKKAITKNKANRLKARATKTVNKKK
ncbi:MAG: 30S ribosomal protein S20 [Mycoplasma sp.]